MRNRFLQGLRHGLPIGLGYLSVSFAFGIFAVGQGLSVWQAVLMSFANITSAGQLAGVPIIIAGGSVIELVITQCIINLRYSLMSISLSQKLDGDVRVGDRMAIAFSNTDEVFAVASSRPGSLHRTYLYGLIVLPVACWTLGTLFGALAGGILPVSVTSALGIMIYGMFIAIVVPSARAERPVLYCVLLAVALSLMFRFVPFLQGVTSGFVIIICAVVSSAILALIRPIDNADENTEAEQ